MVITAHTARVPADVLAGSRELMDLAFDDFEDEDWNHALGGEHAWALEDGRVVAHGSLVLRRCYLGDDEGGRVLRVGAAKVMIKAMVTTRHCPRPHTIPMQAASQVQAALVSPRTLKWRPAWTMTPAPRKPIPVSTPWMTRLTASAPVPS